MNAPRIRPLQFWLALLTALTLACASTGPPRYWTGFYPTYENFERYFDERGQALDPVEGIWASLDTLTATADLFIIIRDSSYAGYDFVGLRPPLVLPLAGQYLVHTREGPMVVAFTPAGAKNRAELFVALRHSSGDERVYEYTDAAVLRGEDCTDKLCLGVYFIAADGRLHRTRAPAEDHSSGCGWIRIHPPP
jgi:hypothetical protein